MHMVSPPIFKQKLSQRFKISCTQFSWYQLIVEILISSVPQELASFSEFMHTIHSLKIICPVIINVTDYFNNIKHFILNGISVYLFHLIKIDFSDS